MRAFVIGVNLAAIVLFGAGPLLAYLRAAPPIVGFGTFALGGMLGVVGVLAAVVMSYRQGPGMATYFGILGAAPLAVLVYFFIAGRNYPLINDVTTDVVNPPQFANAKTLEPNDGRDMSFPNQNAEIIREAYPEVEPVAINAPFDDAFNRALDAVQDLGWTLTLADGKEGRIEAYDETAVFGFVDDIVVRVEKADGGAVVDIRSKSRDGQGDFGANAKRIKAFRDQLAGLRVE